MIGARKVNSNCILCLAFSIPIPIRIRIRIPIPIPIAIAIPTQLQEAKGSLQAYGRRPTCLKEEKKERNALAGLR